MAEGVTLNNRFVTQDEIDERKKKRQEEWEKVRKPDEPLEAPEEVIDNRSLFEKLEEQKTRKQDEYDEQFKLKNQVKGLEEDEAQFLDFVSKRQEELEKAREEEDWQLIRQCKKAMVVPAPENTSSSSEKRSTASAKPTSQKKSQMSLLAGAVKRKSSSSSTDKSGETEDKKRKRSETDGHSDKDSGREETSACLDSSENSDTKNKTGAETGRVIGILPGLGVYTDSSESDSSCSDSDVNTDIFNTHSVIKLEVHGHQ